MFVWRVTRTYDDKGNVHFSVGALEIEKLPKSTFKHTKKCDIYEDFFSKYLQAKAFMAQAKKA